MSAPSECRRQSSKRLESRPEPMTRDEEITRIWNSNAPAGQAWICQEPGCDSWATLGGNAGFHAHKTGHALPVLSPIHGGMILDSHKKSDEPPICPLYCAEDGRTFVYLCPYCFTPLPDAEATCRSSYHLGSDGSGVGRATRSIDLA